jgi:DNA polymerase-3 subunit chi
LFLVDGAEFGELSGYKRCIVLVDGRDEAALTAARAQWVQAKTLGLAGSYWRQQARGWEKQA